MNNVCFNCGQRTNIMLPYWGVSVCGKECHKVLAQYTDKAMDHGSRQTLRVFLAHMVAAKESRWLSEQAAVERELLKKSVPSEDAVGVRSSG